MRVRARIGPNAVAFGDSYTPICLLRRRSCALFRGAWAPLSRGLIPGAL